MKKWFNSQSGLVKLLVLIIPVVNWIVEILVRLDNYQEKKDILSLILFVITVPFGMVFGWVDVVWSLLFGHLLLAK